MFRRLLIVAVVALMPALAGAQTNRDAIAKQIEANERAINAALQKGDAAGFQALAANDAISVDPMGVTPIAEFMKMFSQFKISGVTIDQVKVTFLNDTAAVITYRWQGKGSVMGQPVPPVALASTAWANRGGKWVAVFHQETIPAPMPPAAKK
jgi:uncharacterized protein (TIGR02246 family)